MSTCVFCKSLEYISQFKVFFLLDKCTPIPSEMQSSLMPQWLGKVGIKQADKGEIPTVRR